jgi:hypothetical protein
MDKAVAALNIEHYRKLLATETEPLKRATVERLLAEEEAKLAALSQAHRPGQLPGASPSHPPAADKP